MNSVVGVDKFIVSMDKNVFNLLFTPSWVFYTVNTFTITSMVF